MKKVKLDPLTIAVIVIVMILLFSIAGNYFDSARNRITELEEEIRKDLEALQLSIDKQDELTKKAVTTYRVVITLSFFLIIFAISVAVIFGMSFNDAIEIYLGTVGFFMAMVSVIFYNTWNPDSLLKALKQKVKSWTYKNHGYDPEEISSIQSRVRINQNELDLEYALIAEKERFCQVKQDILTAKNGMA